jgi:hypothetical protein
MTPDATELYGLAVLHRFARSRRNTRLQPRYSGRFQACVDRVKATAFCQAVCLGFLDCPRIVLNTLCLCLAAGVEDALIPRKTALAGVSGLAHRRGVAPPQ